MRILIIILLTSAISLGIVQGQNSTQMHVEIPCEKYLSNCINKYNIELSNSAELLKDTVTNPQKDKLNNLPADHLLRNDDDPTQLETRDKYVKSALGCYNNLLASNPNDERLWVGLGDFYAILGTYHGKIFREKALECYENASNKNSSNIGPFLKMARHYYKYCAEENAIAMCNIVSGIDANSSEALYIKGLAYCDLNKYEDAINCFNESLKINESNSDAYSGMASALVGAILLKINDKHWLTQYERDTSMIEANFTKADDCLSMARNQGNESKGYLIGKGDYHYVYGIYKQKLLPLYEYDPRSYKDMSNNTRDSYHMALISYADALMLDPSDCKLWDKEREILGIQDHRYANAYNYASKMAQKMGYIS
jgi:tetratricopeptide (TPR) repeat protein